MFCGASNAAKLTINARLDLLDGVGAKMQIYVEGKLIFTKDIHHINFQDIVIDAPDFVPGARGDVYFGNDAFAYGQDRNLFIKDSNFNWSNANQPMNTVIGATNGYQGNITRNSGIKNDQGVGIIVASGTKGVTFSGNVGD